MERIAQWKRTLRENADLATQVYNVSDIRKAKADGKVGIILGWQNTSAIEDQLPFIELFHDVGVRVAQLTYNTQNLIGSGCYETRDSGLSDFGREAIDEFNRVGILIDLSHCGDRTASEAIEYSKSPVAYTHIASKAKKDHPRNKTDEQIRAIVDRGGFVGSTFFTTFLPGGADSTMNDYMDVLEHIINVAGEDNIGIGTDVRRDYPAWSPYWPETYDELTPPYWTADKGYARHIVDLLNKKYPVGFKTFSDYPLIVAAMERRRWPVSRIERILGENWLSFLDRVWG